jgi:hypothetical protein
MKKKSIKNPKKWPELTQVNLPNLHVRSWDRDSAI